MKASPSSVLRKIARRPKMVINEAPSMIPTPGESEDDHFTKLGRVIDAVASVGRDPYPVPTLAESGAYLQAWSMIDKGQGGAEGMTGRQRRLALDAMVRLSESTPDTLASMLADAGALGLQSLRDLAMTLMTMERAHRESVSA
jgi:hypothetical protein